MKQDIVKNLLLSIDLKKDKIRGAFPVLIGAIPVEIIWSDGKLEETLIYDDLEISAFPEIKKMMGINAAKSMMSNALKSQWVQELIIKLQKDIERLNINKILNNKKFESIKIIPYKDKNIVRN